MAFDFTQIPFADISEDEPCGYFEDKKCAQTGFFSDWLTNAIPNFPLKQCYNQLLKMGVRRYSSLFYLNKCENCNECTPIRIRVSDFKPSKSQRHVWKKNQDLEIRFVKFGDNSLCKDDEYNLNGDSPLSESYTDQKAVLFREYDFYHNHKDKMDMAEAKTQLFHMHSGYNGIVDMEYWLKGQLIAVGMLDITEDENGDCAAVSSNYFYYDVSKPSLKRSLGVFSVLKEIEFCRQIGAEYYYLGLYLPNCRKMNYKTNYEPYELFLDGKWQASNGRALGGVADSPEGGSLRPTEDLEQAPDGSLGSRNAQFSMINPNMIYEIPIPEDEEYNDICLVTEDIPLQLLYSAYIQGVFPWFDEDRGQPVMWYSPDPRFVIFPGDLHIPKSLKKFLKHTPYTYTMDQAFEQVMTECRKMKRADQNGTWIGDKMVAAYTQFHREGYAHSFEVWHDGRLVGGFYGVLIGSVFCGESMFTIEPDSSKSAFALFSQAFFAAGGKLIDCQCYTDNMARYGAVEICRKDFLKIEGSALLTPLRGDISGWWKR